jgi:hypothetical protein
MSEVNSSVSPNKTQQFDWITKVNEFVIANKDKMNKETADVIMKKLDGFESSIKR